MSEVSEWLVKCKCESEGERGRDSKGDAIVGEAGAGHEHARGRYETGPMGKLSERLRARLDSLPLRVRVECCNNGLDAVGAK